MNHHGYIRPYRTLIPWDNCSLSIKPRNPTREDVLSVLNQVSAEHLRSMQSCVQHAYTSYLSLDALGDAMLLSFLQQVGLQHHGVRLCIAGICKSSLVSNARRAMGLGRKYTYKWYDSYYCPNVAPCDINTSFKVTCSKCGQDR